MLNKPKSETYNLDCLEAMREFPDNYFQLCIADPPYGINRSGQKLSVCKNPKHNRKFFEDKKWDFSIPSFEIFQEIFRVSKNQILWGANYFPQYIRASKGWVYWDKGQEGLTMSDGELAWTSFDKPLRTFRINRAIFTIEKTIHPTQKPVKLYKSVLNTYAQSGDKILDPFLGSGSSRIAAYDLGFDFVGYELDKDYFEAQEERFQRHISQSTIFDIPEVRKSIQTSLFD